MHGKGNLSVGRSVGRVGDDGEWCVSDLSNASPPDSQRPHHIMMSMIFEVVWFPLVHTLHSFDENATAARCIFARKILFFLYFSLQCDFIPFGGVRSRSFWQSENVVNDGVRAPRARARGSRVLGWNAE